MKRILSSLICFLIIGNIQAQEIINISGRITDKETGQALVAASVYSEGTSYGTLSSADGSFTLRLPYGKHTIVISYVGYESERLEVLLPNDWPADRFISLSRDRQLIKEEIVIVGSRSAARTLTSSAVPVDVFSSVILENSGQTDISQALNAIAPSFYSTRLTYSDATDHMDPAALRGLNPDQTLILVNGKRHHPSAVVNVLSVVGRGSVINDLNTIPSAAIERIEILRDGASSQYGSDAIAGVINLVLKSDTSAVYVNTRLGQYYAGDGLEKNFSANYGFGTSKGGFINLTTSFTQREATNRAGIYEGLVYRTDGQGGLSFEENLELDNEIIASRGLERKDFSLHLGNSALSNASVYLNAMLPLSANAEFYAFGGMNYRNSLSAGNYRLPSDSPRNNTDIYPDGFLPEINALLGDQFLSAGIRGQMKDWEVDLSNTYGANRIDFYVNNSLNASMGSSTPRNFESGGLGFTQNTFNLDFVRSLTDLPLMESLDLAFGSEYRIENYRITAGEEASYINEDQIAYPGAQGFPGYQPVDETNVSRSNLGIYADASFNFSQLFLLETAGRYESYSDFGSRFSGKLAGRVSPTPWLNLRASLSSGFRAPSLQQKYYSNTGSYYFGGNLFEVLTASNNSRVAEAFGIPSLNEEYSVSASFGVTVKPGRNTTFTTDFFQVDVTDRVVLSSTFYAFIPEVYSLLEELEGVGGAQFFTNAVDTRTRGMDVFLSHRINFAASRLLITLAANVNQTKVVGDVKAGEVIESNGLSSLLFDRQARALMELAQPRNKVTASINYSLKRLSITYRNSFFGQVSYRGIDESAGELAKDQNYSAKLLTDLKIGYQLAKSININLGANNLFDVYPDKNVESLESFGRFPYNTAVTQFGFNGGFCYAGLDFSF
jgi:iron complex outermembrane receptor protein